jgi:hypothetical protein
MAHRDDGPGQHLNTVHQQCYLIRVLFSGPPRLLKSVLVGVIEAALEAVGETIQRRGWDASETHHNHLRIVILWRVPVYRVSHIPLKSRGFE